MVRQSKTTGTEYRRQKLGALHLEVEKLGNIKVQLILDKQYSTPQEKGWISKIASLKNNSR
jgi:hypothetical protein